MTRKKGTMKEGLWGNAAVIFCFFVSGFAGLLYEICWIRKASLVFGSTNFAVSTVVAVFFGGLALGSYVFGRYTLRTQRPLRVYGYLELGIGVMGMLSPFGFVLAERVYGAFYPLLIEHFAALVAVRFVCVCVLIFGPSFLMGGTLPLFCRQYVASEKKISLSVGLLYGLNTLGAAFGCAVCGFVLIGTIGVNKTIWFAAALNLFIWLAVSQLRVSKRKLPEAAVGQERTERAGETIASKTRGSGYVLIVSFLFFLSGFVGLGNEILLTRYLSLLVRNTVYTYTMTLTIVLAGIVLGSFVISLFGDNLLRRAMLFGVVHICIGLCVLGVLMAPVSWWADVVDTPNLYLRLWMFVLILFLPAVLSGISFPLAIRMVVGEPKLAGFGVGKMSALNTFGGISGSLVMGFAALPVIGIQKSLLMSTAISLFIGFCALILLEKQVKVFIRLAVTAVSIGAWVMLGFFSGTKLPEDFLGLHYKLIDFEEGINSNLSVVRNQGQIQLHIDRLWQGVNQKSNQIMAAHIPMLLHQDPKDVAVIGIGVGQTTSRFLMYDIERLDCVDIEHELVKLILRYFDSEWLDDERCEIIIEDGRNYLTHTDRRYDVISIEIGQVFRPGLSSFYTVDFYQRASEKLKKDGILCQFAPIDFFSPKEYRGVVRSFIEVFPSSVLWYNLTEFLLIGFSSDRAAIPSSRLDLLRSRRRIRKDLRYSYWGGSRYYLNNKDVFLGGFLCGPEALKRMAAGGDVYRDDLPALEYSTAGRIGGKEVKTSVLLMVNDYIEPVTAILQEPLREDKTTEISRIQKLNLGDILAASLYLRSQELQPAVANDKRIQLLERALAFNPDSYPVNSKLADEYKRKGLTEEAIKYYEKALWLDSDVAEIHYHLGGLYQEKEQYNEAVEHFSRYINLDDTPGADVYNNLGSLFYVQGDIERAVEHYQRALEIHPNFPDALYNMGIYYLQNKQYAKAEEFLNKSTEVRPGYAQGQYYLGAVLALQNKHREAMERLGKALELARTNGQEDLIEQIKKSLRPYQAYQEQKEK